MQIKAAVVTEKSGPFAIETIELCGPRPDEVVVRVVASGMCQTDLHGRDGYFVSPYPAVYGHEGAGVVHAVGGAVRSLVAGDHVVMSYPWCGTCANCRQHRLNYCLNSRALKSNGTRADGSTLLAKNGAPVYSAYFQQSSFGTFAITQERYTIKVRKDAPLELLGPLACSGQTGAGAVLNALKPGAGESIVIFGVGAVGLSALMAAKVAGCDPVIAVDIHDHRLALARELGATHIINHKACGDVVGEIRMLTGGGARYTVEASAEPKVLREAIDCLMMGVPVRSWAVPGAAPMRRLKCRSCNRGAWCAVSFRVTAFLRSSSRNSSS
jgi:aryl-alcohol dehydrogenase